MRLDHQRRGGSLLVGLGAWLLRWIVAFLSATLRYEVVAGREHVDELQTAPQPAILCLWHNRSVLALRFVVDVFQRRGLPLVLLASRSRDGELVSRLARRMGVATVRGSSSRGGREALHALYRAITRDGLSPIFAPDGPRGPRYELKVGVVVLAQMSRAPVLPLGFAASRAWRLGSWDRLVVPRPWSRVAVAVGPPQRIERGLDPAGLEAERRRLEALLAELTREAEAAASVSGGGKSLPGEN